MGTKIVATLIVLAAMAGVTGAPRFPQSVPLTGPMWTPVPGLITGDVKWDSVGSPYVIAHDVTIDASATLTILAGVEVRFEGVWTLTVNGTLRVLGGLGNPVTFRQNRTNAPTQFVIGGFRGGSISLDEVVLDDGRVVANGTRFAVNGMGVHCALRSCNDAFQVSEVSNVTMRSVAIDESFAFSSWGLEATHTRGLVLDTFSIQNTSGGVSAWGCDDCRIQNGSFSGLSTSGNGGVIFSGNDSAILDLHFFPPGSHEQITAYGDRNVVRRNHIEAGDFALRVGGNRIVIDGNVIEKPRSFGISVYPTTDALIQNNRVSGARLFGIELSSGSQPAYGSTVVGNDVYGSGWGILSGQTQSIIRGNTLWANGVGAELQRGSNQVDHNHFDFNTVQARDNVPGNAWDDGYPNGGNWWSAYSGDDVYSGPAQDIPGPDGIGDTPQSVPMFGLDRYPFHYVPAPGVPEQLTATPQPGGPVRLTWRPAPMADSYYLYAARSPTGFNFGAPMSLPNATEWTDFGASTPGPHYYILRGHNNTVGRTGPTSNTAGVWRWAFPAGRSTLSLPLASYPWVDPATPGWIDTAEEFVAATGATAFAYMEAGRWRTVPGDGEPARTLRLGEGYLVDLPATTSMSFTGLPGAMIDYATWPPYPLAGFDPASTARQISATIVGDDVIVTWPQLAGIPAGDGSYQVCASTAPVGLRGIPGGDCQLLVAVPATVDAAGTYRHIGALRGSSAWYYQVVPMRPLYLRGASTYSIGVVKTALSPGYTAIGLPLQPFENGTYLSLSVSSLSGPDLAGVEWFDPTRADWVAHTAWMPAGTYDTPLTIIMAVQIDATTPTRMVYTGV